MATLSCIYNGELLLLTHRNGTAKREGIMNNLEMVSKFKAAVKNDDKKVLMEMMSPVIDQLVEMLQAGVLVKNVKRHLENKGITGKACEMVAEMAIIRRESFSHYKAK